MRVRVVTPADPIVDPSEIPGSEDDARAIALIAAATEEIDGPTGWVGRCFGPQTLELVADCWGERVFALPCPPIIGIQSVKYLDANGVEQTVSPSDYAIGSALWFRPNWSAPSLAQAPDPVRIRYLAGYNGTTGAGVGQVQTGALPARARQAVILMAQELLRTGSASFGLRSDTVEGVGAKTFMDGDRASAITLAAVERLLAGLRLYA